VEDAETAQAVAAHVHGRRLPVMMQVNIAGLAHQHGVDKGQVPMLFEALLDIPALDVCGLMCMASKDGDARGCFCTLRHLRDELGDGSLRPPRLSGHLELCMGMSSDYHMAIEEGSNMVRLGSALFEVKNGTKAGVDAKP